MRRLRVGLVGIGFVLSLLAGRLVQLQGIEYGKYRAISERERLHTLTLPAIRGAIQAADGSPLAMTAQADLVFADPTLMKGSTKAQTELYRGRYASQLAGPLGMRASDILHRLNHPPAISPEYVVLKDMVSPQAADQISKLRIAGVAMTPEYRRVYPNGTLAASVLGFATTDSSGVLHGAAGLEYAYNSLLAGHSGSEVIEMSADGEPIPTAGGRVIPAVPGRSIRLTILPALQWGAEQACATRVRQVKADSCMAVVMQPRTGEVLAMAAERPSKHGQPRASADPAVSDVFEPGSTAKVITAAAALERGGQSPVSAYTIPYQITVDGFPFHDADLHPTERLTLAGVLVHSSNVGMVQVAQHVSPRVQYEYFRKFGIGEPTGLGLPGESPGILAPPSKWWGNQRYTLAFGQGVAINAVQLASIYAAIADGGVRIQPTLVAGATDGHGGFIPAPRGPRHRVLQPRTAARLLRILQWVPRLDIGPWGLIPGYAVAAKTGTAQRPDRVCGCLRGYNSSYVGIAPARDPQLVVAVVVENPRSGDYYGNAVAGPVFNKIMKFALQTMKIPPTGGKPPEVQLTAG